MRRRLASPILTAPITGTVGVPGIRLAIVIGVVALLLGIHGGCGSDDEVARAAEVERSRRELANEMADASGVDLETSANMFGVLRELDVLHRGNVPRIDVGIEPSGAVMDGLGNVLKLSAEQWRRVVIQYERAIALHGERLTLRSLPEHHYHDGHVGIVRHLYRVESIGPDRIAFVSLGEVPSDAAAREQR